MGSGSIDRTMTRKARLPLHPELLDRLAGCRLVAVTGKGGVGKTTIAATLARLLSARGRKVLLVEVDPRENLHYLLDVPPSGGAAIKVDTRLWLENVQPVRVLEDLVRQKVAVAALARKIVGTEVFRHFAEGAPGMKEMAVLGHAMQVVEGDAKPKVDVVVLDAPATGHGMSLLWAPLLVSEVLGKGPLGRLAGEVADMVRDPEQVAVVIGTTAEEMPVQEALELIAGLRERLGRPPELLVVNGLYPPFPQSASRAAAGTKAALALWRQRREVNERELERLDSAWHGTRVDLPLLPMERGPALVTALGNLLVRALGPAKAR
jgi:Mrp family chromosome partitioning ATPase